MTASPTTDTPPVQDPVRTFVSSRVHELQHGVLKNRSEAVAALARLRRAVGKPPGAVAEVLQYTLGPELAGSEAGDEATPRETAAHLALTLYALHQQALTEPMHRDGQRYGLGRSARRLIAEKDLPERHPVLHRFQTLGTATSLDELAHHARGLVQQLRSARVPLDYGLLALELLRWQRPGGPEQVRLVWGRDFFVRPSLDHADTNNTSETDKSTES